MGFYYFLLIALFVAILYFKLTYNTRKGNHLEKKIEKILLKIVNHHPKLSVEDSFVYRDIMFGKDDKTSQIDNVLLTPYGIFVIEAKNYKGFIFGSSMQQNWTVTTQSKNKRINKYPFYNPIKQNITHVNYVKNVIKKEMPIYNIVVFGNQAILKKITTDEDAKVLNLKNLKRYLNSLINRLNPIISIEILKIVKEGFEKSINADKNQRKNHVRRIKSSYKK